MRVMPWACQPASTKRPPPPKQSAQLQREPFDTLAEKLSRTGPESDQLSPRFVFSRAEHISPEVQADHPSGGLDHAPLITIEEGWAKHRRHKTVVKVICVWICKVCGQLYLALLIFEQLAEPLARPWGLKKLRGGKFGLSCAHGQSHQTPAYALSRE